ncbi:MAG: hypothetical protein ACFE9T_15845, partial [Promethearchaeota archaeon]
MIIEENIQKIIDSTGLTETEIKELIKKKIDELKELISEKGALFLVAKELGVNLRENKEDGEENKEEGYCRSCGIFYPIEEMAEYDVGGRTFCKYCMAEYEEVWANEKEYEIGLIEGDLNKQVAEFLTLGGYTSHFLTELVKNDFTGDYFTTSFIKSERDYELKGTLYYNPESNKIRKINIPIDVNGTGITYKNLEILHTKFSDWEDLPPIRVIFIGELVKKLIRTVNDKKKIIIKGRVKFVKIDDSNVYLPFELEYNPFVLIVWNFKFIDDSVEDEDVVNYLLKKVDRKVLTYLLDDNSEEIDISQFTYYNLKNFSQSFSDISDIDSSGIYEITECINGYDGGIMFESICFNCLQMEEQCKCKEKKDIRSFMCVCFYTNDFLLFFVGKIAKDLLKEKKEIILKVLESKPNYIGFCWDGILGTNILVKGIIRHSYQDRNWVILVLDYSLAKTLFDETQGLRILTKNEVSICTGSPDVHLRAGDFLCRISFYNFDTMEIVLLNSKTTETSEDFKSIFLKTLLKIKEENPKMRFTFGHIKNTDIITRITIMNLDSNNNNLIINKMKELLAKQTNNKVGLF